MVVPREKWYTRIRFSQSRLAETHEYLVRVHMLHWGRLGELSFGEIPEQSWNRARFMGHEKDNSISYILISKLWKSWFVVTAPMIWWQCLMVFSIVGRHYNKTISLVGELPGCWPYNNCWCYYLTIMMAFPIVGRHCSKTISLVGELPNRWPYNNCQCYYLTIMVPFYWRHRSDCRSTFLVNKLLCMIFDGQRPCNHK